VKHALSIGACATLALLLQVTGPSDDAFPSRILAVGGADCNSSDHITFDCVELAGKIGACSNTTVASANQQTCMDEVTSSKTICTENLCQNETKDQGSSGTCKKINCGG